MQDARRVLPALVGCVCHLCVPSHPVIKRRNARAAWSRIANNQALGVRCRIIRTRPTIRNLSRISNPAWGQTDFCWLCWFCNCPWIIPDVSRLCPAFVRSVSFYFFRNFRVFRVRFSPRIVLYPLQPRSTSLPPALGLFCLRFAARCESCTNVCTTSGDRCFVSCVAFCFRQICRKLSFAIQLDCRCFVACLAAMHEETALEIVDIASEFLDIPLNVSVDQLGGAE